MLTATPQDVPRLRDRLADYFNHPTNLLAGTFANHNDGPLMFPHHPGLPGRPGRKWSIAEFVAALRQWVKQAELYYVTDEMTDVVRAAGEAMPLYDLHRDAPPADVGLMVWGGPACVVDDTAPDMPPGGRVEIRAALWARVPETGDGPGVLLVTLQDSEVMLAAHPDIEADVAAFARAITGPLGYHEEYPLPYGNRPFGMSGRATQAVAAALTTWIMMGQRITTETPAALPRAVRRQAVLAGRPAPTVRVITLRRTAPKQRPETPDADAAPGRTYTKRWVVKGYGYWRNTWYPSTQEHRLQFVHVPAYVKGPEGAPVIGGERVNVLRR